MADRDTIWYEHPLARRLLVALSLIAGAVGLWARFWHLGTITDRIFDEVYFPAFANAFLHHTVSFDVHPPLGKFLIAVGIHFFGNMPFGWRIVPAVFGIFNVAALLWIWKQLGGGMPGMWLLLLFASLDGMLIVYSRTGLIDGILLDLILLTFGLALRVTEESSLLPLATVLGLACSIKWIGLGVIIPVIYLMWRRHRLAEFILHLPWTVLVYSLVVVAGQVIGGVPNPWQAAWDWNVQAWNYQKSLHATHPYASKWWSWPLMLRPVLFYYQGVPGGTAVMDAMSSPVLWSAADLGVLTSLGYIIAKVLDRDWKIFDHPLVPLMIGYLAFWLPFSLITRVLFIYHYLPAYAMALLMLAYWLEWLWKRQPWLVLLLAAVITGFSLYFLPFAIATPLSQVWLTRHIWYYHWIY